MPVFFVIAHKIVFKFHAQPKTGAYSCYLFWKMVENAK